MSQFTMKDYYKEAFYYHLHHFGYEETIQLLDKTFSMTDVSTMAVRYLCQFSSLEEREIFNTIQEIEQLNYYTLIMRVKDKPLDVAVKYLKDRKITSYYLQFILKKVEANANIMPEECQYLQNVIEEMDLWDKNGGKMPSVEDKVKLQKEKEYKIKRIKKAEKFLEGFLSKDNPVPIFMYYCQFHNTAARYVKADIELLRTTNPKLYNQFLDVYKKRDSEEYKKQFLEYMDTIIEKVSSIVEQAKREGRRPDLVDYYQNISIPYPALLRTINKYYTKKENDLLATIHYHFSGYNKARYNEGIATDGISINGISFSREEQNKVYQWLEENHLPTTKKVFLDQMRRLSEERKNTDRPKTLIKK